MDVQLGVPTEERQTLEEARRIHLPPRWVVAVSVAVAAAILGDSLLYAVLPTQWPHLGLDVGMVGVLLGVNRLVRLASNPLAGWAVRRWGVKGPFLAALFAASATTAAYASSLGFLVLLTARLLWGVCWSFLRLGGYLAALDASNDGSRGYYLGFFNGVSRFGSFVAVLAGGILTDLMGFRATVFLFTGLTLAGGLGVVRERPARQAGNRPRAEEVVPSAAVVPLEGPEGTARIWAVYAAVFVHGMAVSGLVTASLGLWLLTLYGSTTQVFFLTLGVAPITGSLLSARFLADFLWGPFAGHLSDRYGRASLALVVMAGEAAALLGLAADGGLCWTVASALGLFLAATTLQVTLDATAGGLAPPARRALTMSWYATCLDLGAAIGPLVGYLVGVGVGLEWMYRGVAGLLVLVGLLYAVVFWREIAARERAA